MCLQSRRAQHDVTGGRNATDTHGRLRLLPRDSQRLVPRVPARSVTLDPPSLSPLGTCFCRPGAAVGDRRSLSLGDENLRKWMMSLRGLAKNFFSSFPAAFPAVRASVFCCRRIDDWLIGVSHSAIFRDLIELV